MQGALVAAWVAAIADDGEDGLVSLLRVDSHEVANLLPAPARFIAPYDIVDLASIDVASRIAVIGIGQICERGLRDVVPRKRILGALQDGTLLVVYQVTDDLLVGMFEIVCIDEDVECLLARRAVGVGGAIDINIHAMCPQFE